MGRSFSRPGGQNYEQDACSLNGDEVFLFAVFNFEDSMFRVRASYFLPQEQPHRGDADAIHRVIVYYNSHCFSFGVCACPVKKITYKFFSSKKFKFSLCRT